jgi:glutamate racemase
MTNPTHAATRAPIGMLDSGVGGFSVLSEIQRLLPHEDIIYMADQGHLPYGERPRDEIRGFVEGITRYLIERGCKLLIIACNAANAAALHPMRAMFPDYPIIGMEPAIKPAAANSKTGVVGVITTRATFQGELLASVIDRFAQGIRVETQVCPDFVTLVEAGDAPPQQIRETVARYLGPLRQAGIDQLVIGCTHFPFLNDYFTEYLGSQVTIVDPAPAVARQTQRVLDASGLRRETETTGTVEFITTADPDHYRDLIHAMLGLREPTIHPMQWVGGALAEATSVV